MSHTRKCGCVIADGRDRAVRKGYVLGGYVKAFCEEHGRSDFDTDEETVIFHNIIFYPFIGADKIVKVNECEERWLTS